MLNQGFLIGGGAGSGGSGGSSGLSGDSATIIDTVKRLYNAEGVVVDSVADMLAYQGSAKYFYVKAPHRIIDTAYHTLMKERRTIQVLAGFGEQVVINGIPPNITNFKIERIVSPLNRGQDPYITDHFWFDQDFLQADPETHTTGVWMMGQKAKTAPEYIYIAKFTYSIAVVNGETVLTFGRQNLGYIRKGLNYYWDYTVDDLYTDYDAMIVENGYGMGARMVVSYDVVAGAHVQGAVYAYNKDTSTVGIRTLADFSLDPILNEKAARNDVAVVVSTADEVIQLPQNQLCIVENPVDIRTLTTQAAPISANSTFLVNKDIGKGVYNNAGLEGMGSIVLQASTSQPSFSDSFPIRNILISNDWAFNDAFVPPNVSPIITVDVISSTKMPLEGARFRGRASNDYYTNCAWVIRYTDGTTDSLLTTTSARDQYHQWSRNTEKKLVDQIVIILSGKVGVNPGIIQLHFTTSIGSVSVTEGLKRIGNTETEFAGHRLIAV